MVQNSNLSDLLSSQTSSIERLTNELEGSQSANHDLNVELNGMQIQMDRLKEENKTLKKAMSGQTKELEKHHQTVNVVKFNKKGTSSEKTFGFPM